jgi:hypothetical protein
MLIKKKKFRDIFFYFIAYLPFCLLLFLTGTLLIRIHEINNINFTDISHDLSDHFRKSGNISIFMDSKINGSLSSVYEYLNSSDNTSDFLIYVYGESSLVDPSRKEAFPSYLEKILNSKKNSSYKVVNLGVEGIDSSQIKKIYVRSIAIKKPNLTIIYAGHNDYNNAYNNYINPHYYLIRNREIRIFLGKLIHLFGENHKDMSVVFRFNIEPRLLKFFQKTKLLHMDYSFFSTCNSLILKNYAQNIFEILAMSKRDKIPVIFITPIGNLEAEPFGVNNMTYHVYQIGFAEKNYSKRFYYLNKAKDHEIFSGDLRAKSELNDFLRGLANQTYIFDLESDFRSREFSFSYENFFDYLHLRREAHFQIASALYTFLLKENLI